VRRFPVYLGRFALILAGYACAALAASAFIHLLFLGTLDWRPDEVPVVVTGSLVFSIPFVALFVAYFAFVPSVPVVLLAELIGRRDWLFYALGGAVVAAAVLGMFWMGAEPLPGGLDLGSQPVAVDPAVRDPRFAMLLAGGGIVGGMAYWLVAGRLAGNWRARVRRPAAEENPN
jgi:hypothetical protein